MEQKFIHSKDFVNYNYPKLIFKGIIKKISFKLSAFFGYIAGKEIKFNGEYYLENGFDIEYKDNIERAFEVVFFGPISKTHVTHSGHILIEYETKPTDLFGNIKINKFTLGAIQ